MTWAILTFTHLAAFWLGMLMMALLAVAGGAGGAD